MSATGPGRAAPESASRQGATLLLPPGHAPRRIVLDASDRTRLSVAATAGSERQRHGFLFQAGAIELLGLHEPEGYTHPTDAFSADPAVDSHAEKFSFKCIKAGSPIELGSADRNANPDQDFYFIVAFWTGTARTVQEVCVMHVPACYWRSLFPADMSPFLAESVFDGITNSYDDDARWKERTKKLKAEWRSAVPNSPIDIRFKRDHKHQKRVQCAIKHAGFAEVFARTYNERMTRRFEDALRA